MTFSRHRKTRLGLAFLALALLAIAFRSLLPGGYMFAPSHEGRMSVVAYCIEHGAVEQVISPGPEQGVHDKDDRPQAPNGDAPHQNHPCVFAATVGVTPIEQCPVEPSAVEIAIAKPQGALALIAAAGMAAPPPWATGPPLLI